MTDQAGQKVVNAVNKLMASGEIEMLSPSASRKRYLNSRRLKNQRVRKTDPITAIEQEEGPLTTGLREATTGLVKDLMKCVVLQPFSDKKRRLLIARLFEMSGLRKDLERELVQFVKGEGEGEEY